jgi:hypothetical protein
MACLGWAWFAPLMAALPRAGVRWLRCVRLASTCLPSGQGLAGYWPIDQALADYQRRRDQLTANEFELALATARLAPLSPWHEGIYRAAAYRLELSS